MNLNPASPLSNPDAPDRDVVMSCRVRLARNIAGIPFVNTATEPQCREIVSMAKSTLIDDVIAPGMFFIDLADTTSQARQLLVERHLISRHLAEAPDLRGVAISADESLSIMINEEDHLRMQVISPGMQLGACFARINEVDDLIDQRVEYAYDKRWGYLTVCPTNVGTGIRFSVMLHLPALQMTNELKRVRRAAKAMRLAVRGYYGEGSETTGDFYQISNQITLGKSEDDLLADFLNTVVPSIVDYERKARRALVERSRLMLDDRVHRALSILRSARLLGLEEAMKLLSRVRLGYCTGLLKEISPSTLATLSLQVQPAHLCKTVDRDQLETDEAREVRAQLVRRVLSAT
jgi:protein arginine kinase